MKHENEGAKRSMTLDETNGRDLLVGEIAKHEKKCHEGDICRTERCNTVAWLADCLQLTVHDMDSIAKMLKEYQELPNELKQSDVFEGLDREEFKW